MKWDFKSSDVIKGEVDYSLEEFYEDLREEVKLNHKKYGFKGISQLLKLFYSVMYLTFLKWEKKDIAKGLNIEEEFVELIVKNNKENIKMLEACVMSKLIKNIAQFNGLLSNRLNIELVNAQLKNFHIKHKIIVL